MTVPPQGRSRCKDDEGVTKPVAIRLKMTLGLLLGSLILVWGLAPYGFGWRTEQTIRTLVQVAEHVFDVPLYTTQYHRGWFGATAETWLALPPVVLTALRPYLPPTWLPSAAGDGLTLTHHIQHGPFPLGQRPDGLSAWQPVQTIMTSLVLPGASGSVPAASPLLRIDTTVFLGGAGRGSVTMPAFSIPRPGASEPQMVWGGLQGEVRVDTHGRDVTGTLRAPALAWSGEDVRVTWADVALRTAITTPRHQPTRSVADLRVGTVAVTPHAHPHDVWDITGATVEMDTTVARHILHGTVALSLQTAHLDALAYGPGTATLALTRISLPAFVHFWHTVSQRWHDEPSLAALWTRVLLSGELAEFLLPLLQASPELALSSLSVQTPDGALQATLQVRVDARRLLPPGYMVQLLQTVEAEATIAAPVVWVRSLALRQARRAIRAQSRLTTFLPDAALNAIAGPLTDHFMQNLLQQGYVVLDGARYTSQARYRHGQLWVQGKLVDGHEAGPAHP